MAGASANAKSWLLPVVTAAFGFCAVERELSIGLLGLGAVMLFAVVDAQYLRQERAFRALYRDAVSAHVPLFEMSPARYHNKPNADEEDKRAENCRWGAVIWSWSLAGFYLPMLIVGAVIAATTVPWSDVKSMIC
jgi:histidine triad (HIT) family protein